MVLLTLLGCGPCPEWRVDDDGDGFGTSGLVITSCREIEGRVTTKGDCDDADPAVHPGAIDVCNGIDDDCDPATLEDRVSGVPVWRDRDGDGYGGPTPIAFRCPRDGDLTIGGDCNDQSPEIHPGQEEVACSGVDEDCDPDTPDGIVWHRDADRDGFGDPDEALDPTCTSPGAGWARDGTDCDDSDPSIHGPGHYWTDLDGDGYGTGASGFGCRPPDTAEEDGDCDDGDPLVNPWRCEQCNEVDDDCNGLVDDGVLTTFWPDADGDGRGEDGASFEACVQPAGSVRSSGDCDDAHPEVHREAPEICDGLDNDCDGAVDEGLRVDFFDDADGDGRALDNAAVVATACARRPPGTTSLLGDCDDADPERFVGAPERCDAIDHDCDGDPTLGAVDRWYLDLDGDGFGDSRTAIVGCAPGGRVARGGDVDDRDPNVFPGAAEVCGGPRSDGDPRTDPCAPATCVWIREGGGTTFYDLDTARRVGSVPCELWSVRADGYALALRQQPIESFIQIDPTSGTCDRVADALSPELPYGDVYCYDDYYEPYWYLPPYEEPYWDERGCYHEGYSPYGSSCIGSYAAPSVARFDPEGDLWLTWSDYAPGGNHYDGTGPDVIDTWSTGWRRNDGLAFSGPGRTWTRDVDTWDAVDAALAPVGVPVEGGSLEDALDGRMVAGAADWRQAAMFVDGRDGTVLSPFAPFDARDVLAVGLDRYLALLPDRSVVLTDGEGSLTPFLPASSAERDLLEISPCP